MPPMGEENVSDQGEEIGFSQGETISDDVEKNEVDAGISKDDDGSEGEEETQTKRSCFSDERGNLKFVNVVVRNPCSIFFTLLFINLAITFLLFRIVFSEGNPFTNTENEFDLKDVRSIQYDSLRLAKDEVSAGRESSEASDVTTRVQSQDADFTYWVFEGETEAGVFGSAESIGAMKEAFDLFLDDAEYEDYCLLDYPEGQSNATETEPSCVTPLTPLTMYYASEWDSEKVAAVLDVLKVPGNIERFNDYSLCFALGLFCELLGDDVSNEDRMFVRDLNMNLTDITSSWDMKGELVQNFTQVTELAAYVRLVNIYAGLVNFGFDKGFEVDNLKSDFSRGIVRWGGPLTEQSSNQTAEELEDLEDSDNEKRKTYIVDNFLEDMNELATDDTNSDINSYYFMAALIFDVLIAIVSVDGMLAIISLTFVFLWLRINTASWFLSFVGIMEIFLALPVSWFIYSVVLRIEYFSFLNALTIFIVAAIGADDIFIFFDAYKQSKHKDPGLLVDMETRMSWVYRRTGTAMAITSATTCSAFLCTLITPLASINSFGIFAAVVIFIDYVLVMTLFCTAVVIYHDRYEERGCFGCCCTTCSKTKPSPTEKALEEAKEDGSEEFQGDRVSRFFRFKVSPFVQMPVHRIVIFVVFLAWVGVAVWQTTKIEAVKESEQFLAEDHPLQKSVNILNREFPTADDDTGLKVYYAWGLGEVDRAGVNLLLDPENYGAPTFLESFDFNEQCQTELLNVCDKLKTDPAYADLIKRKRGLGLTYCFIEELAVYNLNGDLSDCDYVRQGSWKNQTWQVAPGDLGSIMDGFLQQRSCFDSTATVSSIYSNEIGWDGTSMKYAAIAAESLVLNPFSRDAESTTRAEYDQFVAIANELDPVVSAVCSGPVIMTDLDTKFVFMNNQAIYVQSAVQSSVLGVAIAFAVLLVSTRVFHIAFFASLSIISVLASVTGTMVMLGWSLGSIESILIGITAGFSVDYVVHLAHAYVSAKGDAYERMTESFGDMGISVLNGMVTSIAASIPLFFCQLQFFAKFGTFLCLTIAFSWLFANFAFMSVLAQFKIPIKKKGGCSL